MDERIAHLIVPPFVGYRLAELGYFRPLDDGAV